MTARTLVRDTRKRWKILGRGTKKVSFMLFFLPSNFPMYKINVLDKKFLSSQWFDLYEILGIVTTKYGWWIPTLIRQIIVGFLLNPRHTAILSWKCLKSFLNVLWRWRELEKGHTGLKQNLVRWESIFSSQESFYNNSTFCFLISFRFNSNLSITSPISILRSSSRNKKFTREKFFFLFNILMTWPWLPGTTTSWGKSRARWLMASAGGWWRNRDR